MRPHSVLLVFGWSTEAGDDIPELPPHAHGAAPDHRSASGDDRRLCCWQLPQQSCSWGCAVAFCAQHGRIVRLRSPHQRRLPPSALGQQRARQPMMTKVEVQPHSVAATAASAVMASATAATAPPLPTPRHQLPGAPPPLGPSAAARSRLHALPLMTSSTSAALNLQRDLQIPPASAHLQPSHSGAYRSQQAGIAGPSATAAAGWAHVVTVTGSTHGTAGSGGGGGSGAASWWAYDSDGGDTADEPGSASPPATPGAPGFPQPSTSQGAASAAAAAAADDGRSPAGQQPCQAAGRRWWRQLETPYDAGAVVQLAAGELHSMALDVGGAVWAWGANEDGQCGTAQATAEAAEAPEAAGDGPCFTSHIVRHVAFPVRVRQVSCGARHSLAVDCGGAVWAWGWNAYGQCGVAALAAGGAASRAAVAAPARVQGGALGGVPCRAVAAGLGHSMALTEAGQVAAWGWNDAGQCGLGGSMGSTAAAGRATTAGSGAGGGAAPGFLADPQLVPIARPRAGTPAAGPRADGDGEGGRRVCGGGGPGGVGAQCGWKRGREGRDDDGVGAGVSAGASDGPSGCGGGGNAGHSGCAAPAGGGGSDEVAAHGGVSGSQGGGGKSCGRTVGRCELAGDDGEEDDDEGVDEGDEDDDDEEEEDVIKISCGGRHSLALAAGGRLYGWGSNTRGQLGVRPAVHACTTPQLMLPASSASRGSPSGRGRCGAQGLDLDLDLDLEMDLDHNLDPYQTATGSSLLGRGGGGAGRAISNVHSDAGLSSRRGLEGMTPGGLSVFLAFTSSGEAMGSACGEARVRELAEVDRMSGAGRSGDEEERGHFKCGAGGGGVVSLRGRQAGALLRRAVFGAGLVVEDVEGGWSHTVVRLAH